MPYSGLMATKELLRSPAVEDYSKAIFSLAVPQRRAGLDERAGRATGHHAGLGLGDAQEARRAGADHPRALPRSAPDRRRAAPRARGDPPSPAARELPGRGAGDALGSSARRGRGARARALRGSRGADRGQARQPDGGPARRPDPERRSRARRSPRPAAWRAWQPGDEGVFVRVSDSDPEMLRYLAGCGISPGDRFAVRERQPFGGPLFVRLRRARARDRRPARRRDARRGRPGARRSRADAGEEASDGHD